MVENWHFKDILRTIQFWDWWWWRRRRWWWQWQWDGLSMAAVRAALPLPVNDPPINRHHHRHHHQWPPSIIIMIFHHHCHDLPWPSSSWPFHLHAWRWSWKGHADDLPWSSMTFYDLPWSSMALLWSSSKKQNSTLWRSSCYKSTNLICVISAIGTMIKATK